tara:strand:+ start:317 stop:532 length:216 start_codon:yes stop_codon:yes gene_type:complete
MNKKITSAVHKRIILSMWEDEKKLKDLLNAETNGVPDEQLDGLMVKIEQLLGKVTLQAGKIMLLQTLEDDS